MNDDLPVAGNFLCSNDLINRIYTNIVWGTRGNYRSLPTDCPQRDERQGWLGDRSEECKGEAYLFDISALYAKWRAGYGRRAAHQRQHPRCGTRLLADLFRQRDVAEQCHHHSERVGTPVRRPREYWEKVTPARNCGWNT